MSNKKARKAVLPLADAVETREAARQGAGRTRARNLAMIAASGTLSNAVTMGNFSGQTVGEMDLFECANALIGQAHKIHDGDLRSVEMMLSTQAVALNAIFGEMARRAALNMGEYPDAFDRYMRMALKAQGQSRATLETLAAIKQGPMVFARQANIAHGPQQVNNGSMPADARVGNVHSAKSELLEASDGERLDTGAAGASGRGDPALATLGALDGTAHRRG